MFCSLIGISPCDIILQDIDNRVVKILLKALDNRFDASMLRRVKAEFDYVLDILDSMIFDYERREDRVLARKLSVAAMTAFGDVDAQNSVESLKNAKKSFTGNLRVKGQTLAAPPAAHECLTKLWEGRERLDRMRNTIECRSYSDEVFFDRPLTWWAGARSSAWLSAFTSDRIERQDDVQGMMRSAKSLLSLVDREGPEEIIVEPPTLRTVCEKYINLTGEQMSESEEETAQEFVNLLCTHNLNDWGEEMVSGFLTAFVYCMIASKQCVPEVADALEQCGLFFMNPVRAELMTSVVGDLTIVPEKRVTLRELEDGDPYGVMLNAIIACCENDRTAIGAELSGGD